MRSLGMGLQVESRSRVGRWCGLVAAFRVRTARGGGDAAAAGNMGLTMASRVARGGGGGACETIRRGQRYALICIYSIML